MIYASDAVNVALITSTTTIIVALITGGFLFHRKVTRPMKRIENAVNHVKEGEPTLIQRVATLEHSQELFRGHMIMGLQKISRQIGIILPPFEDKPEKSNE